jgi:TetR/AcrR family fatty acid metabolism transcriptional regulator
MNRKSAAGPTKRADNRGDVRQRIIGAAVKLFAQKGFFETTVDDIARSAKIAKGTVYIYFKDKPSLYAGIIDEHFTGAVQFLKEIEAKRISNTDKLHVLAEDWLNYMLKFKHQFPMFTMENVDMTRKIMRGIHVTAFGRVGEIVDHIARIIESGIAVGEFRKVDPKIGAMYFLNSIRTVFQACTMLPKCREPKKQIVEMLFSGLKKETK